MSNLDNFTVYHGQPTLCEQPIQEAFDYFDSILPDVLLDHWQDVGWCSFSDGLIWTVDPMLFRSSLRHWIDEDDAYVIARTGFGNLILYRNGKLAHLQVHIGEMTSLPFDVSHLFNGVLVDPEFLGTVLDKRLHDLAQKKLGALQSDECYAFNPALALGGARKIKHLIKVKMLAHLLLLAQVHKSRI